MKIVTGKRLDPRIYNVDYTAMMPHKVLVHSLRHKDFFVFAVSITSILLKLQLVFTSSLFQAYSVTVTKPVQVDTLNDFATSEVDMTILSASTGPYYHAKALQGHEAMYPFGVMPGGAYQTFRAQGVAGDERRGIVDAPLTVVVNGTFMDVECMELKNYTVVLSERQQFTANLQFEGCDEVFTVGSVNPLWRFGRGGFWGTANIDNGKSCPSLPQQYASFLNYGILFQQNERTKNIESVEKCAAILCSAKSWMSKVRVIDDGILPIVSILEPSFRGTTTAIKNPWDMIRETIPPNTQMSVKSTSPDGGGGTGGCSLFSRLEIKRN
jgi:ribosomal protein S27E